MGYSPWGRKESDTTEQLSTLHRHTRTTMTIWDKALPGDFESSPQVRCDPIVLDVLTIDIVLSDDPSGQTALPKAPSL